LKTYILFKSFAHRKYSIDLPKVISYLRLLVLFGILIKLNIDSCIIKKLMGGENPSIVCV
jgi:hypothetical protein